MKNETLFCNRVHRVVVLALLGVALVALASAHGLGQEKTKKSPEEIFSFLRDLLVMGFIPENQTILQYGLSEDKDGQYRLRTISGHLTFTTSDRIAELSYHPDTPTLINETLLSSLLNRRAPPTLTTYDKLVVTLSQHETTESKDTIKATVAEQLILGFEGKVYQTRILSIYSKRK